MIIFSQISITLVLAPILLVSEPAIRTEAASEMQNDNRQNTTPPARDPRVAVEEEYQLALERRSVEALELFITRHPNDPLAEKARADIRLRPR